eukprot:2788652-Rhodomonas_salina.1
MGSVCTLGRLQLLASLRIWQHAMASLVGARLAGAPATCPTAGRSMAVCCQPELLASTDPGTAAG